MLKQAFNSYFNNAPMGAPSSNYSTQSKLVSNEPEKNFMTQDNKNMNDPTYLRKMIADLEGEIRNLKTESTQNQFSNNFHIN